jgi:hypothetical protein
MAIQRRPPEGYCTATEAQKILGNTLLYKYVEKGIIKRYKPASLKHGYYKISEVQAVASADKTFFEDGIIINPDRNETTFSRATVDDADGIYAVAISHFPGTTSALDRRELLTHCPDGQYVIKEGGEIVAFVIMHPTRPGSEQEQIVFDGRGLGRPWGPQDVDCFAPGKTVNVLVRSIAVTEKYGRVKARHYMQRLLLGTMSALADMGKQGVSIGMFYGVSESPTGIALCLHAGMKVVKQFPNKDRRYKQGYNLFVLEIAETDTPLLRPYKQNIAEWQRERADTAL